jgi:uncharacterized protein (TIGR02391 family)
VEQRINRDILEIFGPTSPEYLRNQHYRITYISYAGGSDAEYQRDFEGDLPNAITFLQGLIENLEEAKIDFSDSDNLASNSSKNAFEPMWALIHKRIQLTSQIKFEDGHYADAVESALKEVNKRVKESFLKCRGEERDGSDLMFNAFSIKNPVIVLDDLGTESGKNVQEGYTQIFAGVMRGIRNPNAHDNLLISPERAMHYLFLASLLMYKLDEAVST